MLRLRNHLFPLLRASSPLLSPTRASSPLLSPIHHRACLLLSTSPTPFSFEDYLVAACGLTPGQAGKASKKAFKEASQAAGKPFEEFSSSRLNTASNPDAVLALLNSAGLSRADIAAVVAADALLLRSSVKNIGPRLLALRDRLRLSAPQIVRFLLVGSRALRSCDVCPKLEFFISFYGSFEQLLVAAKRNKSILTVDHDRIIKPNIALFRQCGLSVRDIVQMCSNSPRIISYNPERVKDFVLRAEKLGVPRRSGMFKYAVAVVACVSEAKIAARLEFLKRTLGCSESEVGIAVSNMPNILGRSEECLLRKIQFLINEVGLEPQYIVRRPTLLGLSLEKRLVPRHCVMKVLQAKRLLNSNMGFYSFANIGEETFKLRYIDCHKDSVPGLADSYAAARAGAVPSGI